MVAGSGKRVMGCLTSVVLARDSTAPRERRQGRTAQRRRPEMRELRTTLTVCASNRHDVRMTDRARDEHLIEFVRTHGTATVEALSREIGVGPSTIRRDLHRL